jgi:hypothetical protein
MSDTASRREAEGLELCDAGFFAAGGGPGARRVLALEPEAEPRAWPGFIHCLGGEWVAGPAAEDEWMVHPREVSHSFWDRLSLNEADIPGSPPATCSELAYHCLRQFTQEVTAATGPFRHLGMAVPGAYLQTPEDEELKIGLLLGMAQDLRMPLVMITDLATAALAAAGRASLGEGPAIVVDVHLHATELTLLEKRAGAWRRTRFLLVPNVGQVPIMRHLMGTMGNRFLRQTAFDIQEDRRLEQVFYHDLKRFYEAGGVRPHEHVFQINTTRRSYEMKATREQLSADLQAFERQVVQGVQRLAAGTKTTPRVVLTARSAQLDGLDALLRDGGFGLPHILPDGAAALGAARLAEGMPGCDLLEVPVADSLPVGLPDDGPDAGLQWELRPPTRRVPPAALTHVAADGCLWSLTDLRLHLTAESEGLRFRPGQSGEEGAALAELRGTDTGLVITGPDGRLVAHELVPGARLVVRCDGRRTELWGLHSPPSPAG